MKKVEIDSILLANQYLMCKILESDQNKVELARRYLGSRINKVLQERKPPHLHTI